MIIILNNVINEWMLLNFAIKITTRLSFYSYHHAKLIHGLGRYLKTEDRVNS